MRDEIEFWASGSRESNGCLVWKRGLLKRGGYGQVNWHGKIRRVARVAWILVYGPIPKGLDVCHICDNPPCFEPTHLWLGTRAENIQDKIKKGRQTFGDAHARSVLTEAMVRDLRKAVAGGESVASYARRTGFKYSTLRDAACGKRWKYLNG